MTIRVLRRIRYAVGRRHPQLVSCKHHTQYAAPDIRSEGGAGVLRTDDIDGFTHTAEVNNEGEHSYRWSHGGRRGASGGRRSAADTRPEGTRRRPDLRG